MKEVAIIQADTSGTICMWNGGAEALLGYPSSQALGRSLDIVVPEGFRDAHWKGFRAAMERKGMTQDEAFVLPVLCNGGEVRHLAGRLMYLKDAYDNSVGAMAIFVEEREMPGRPDLYRL